MSSKRTYLILIGCICLLTIGLIGGTYGAHTLLVARANNLTALKAKSAALSQQQITLNKAKKDLQTYADLEKIAHAVVPEDKDQAQAVREIVNIAADNNISLSNITFPASTLGGSAPASTSNSTTATTPTASANSKTTKLSQLQPVKNIAGVYALQITVQSDSTKPVPYNKFVTFLSAMEHNRRTAQVTNISIQPSKDDPSLLSFTLQLNEYIKP
jgi:hypothetical protein